MRLGKRISERRIDVFTNKHQNYNTTAGLVLAPEKFGGRWYMSLFLVT